MNGGFDTGLAAAYLLCTVLLRGYVIIINKVITNYGLSVLWPGVFKGRAGQIGVGKIWVARRGRTRWVYLLVNNPFVKHARAMGLDWLDKRLDLKRVFFSGRVWLVVSGHFRKDMREENKKRVRQTSFQIGDEPTCNEASTNFIYSV